MKEEESKVTMWVEVEPGMYQKRVDALKYDLVSVDPTRQRTTYRRNRSEPVKTIEEIRADGGQVVNICVKTIR